MRLTLEPTSGTFDYPTKIVVETKYDYLSLEEVIDKLIRPSLCAWGFGTESINEFINVEE